MAEMVYLAGPYSKGGPDVRLARFNALTTAAARMIETGQVVYSPITMTHPIDLVLSEDGQVLESEFWVTFDEAFMAHCSKIVVLTLPGWQNSSGVTRELEFFRNRGIEAKYMAPHELGILPEKESYAAAFNLA